MTPFEAKIKLFIIKHQMRMTSLGLSLLSRVNEVRQTLGNKFKEEDPYGEENWEE